MATDHQSLPPTTGIAVPSSTDPTAPSTQNTSPPQVGEQRPAWSASHSSKWRLWHSFGLLLLILAIGVAGATLPPLWSFLSTLVLLTVFLAVAGHGVVGLWLGTLIDERNRMSLSRLQMTLWTIIVLSSLLTAVLWNVLQSLDPKNPKIAIKVPQELWLVMGISVTSLVGAPLVLSIKKAVPAGPSLSAQAAEQAESEEKRTREELARQGLPSEAVIIQGKLAVWRWPWDARLADLFQGEERSNAAQLDLGKVQMLFFTIVLVFAYGVTMADLFGSLTRTASISELPPFDASMIALLAISHAGYLTNKVVPHSVP